MAKDACLECGKTLPANKELAAIPNGRLVAFDPTANRVWRICAKCRHWNLLGPEASSAAMPELMARFASLPSAGPEGLAKAKVSDTLELYRVGGPQERAAATLAIALAQREMTSSAVKGVSVTLIVLLALQVWNQIAVFSALGFRYVTGISLFIGISGLFIPFKARTNWADRHLPLPMALLGTGLAANGFLSTPWILASVISALVFGIAFRFEKESPNALVWTPGLDDLGLKERWGPPVSVRELPFLLDPPDVSATEASEASRQAVTLGSLRAALAHVCRELGQPEGRLVMAELSKEHLLLMAMAARISQVEPQAEIHSGVADAQAVAEVAQSLDQTAEGA
ncbi:MAG: hypothetical protein V9E87_15575 [Gemmatimonadales bacterium]